MHGERRESRDGVVRGGGAETVLDLQAFARSLLPFTRGLASPEPVAVGAGRKGAFAVSISRAFKAIATATFVHVWGEQISQILVVNFHHLYRQPETPSMLSERGHGPEDMLDASVDDPSLRVQHGGGYTWATVAAARVPAAAIGPQHRVGLPGSRLAVGKD